MVVVVQFHRLAVSAYGSAPTFPGPIQEPVTWNSPCDYRRRDCWGGVAQAKAPLVSAASHLAASDSQAEAPRCPLQEGASARRVERFAGVVPGEAVAHPAPESR